MSELDIKYNEIEDLDYCLELLKKRDKKIKVLESIIKEVREYIESDYILEEVGVCKSYITIDKEKLLEILDRSDDL